MSNKTTHLIVHNSTLGMYLSEARSIVRVRATTSAKCQEGTKREWDDDWNWRSGTFKDRFQWSGESFNGGYVIVLMCIIEHIPAFQRYRLGDTN